MSARWFEVDARENVSLHGMGVDYEATLDLARDALARPHDRAALDALMLDCAEVSTLLVSIARDDGDVRFVRDAFAALVLDVVRRSS